MAIFSRLPYQQVLVWAFRIFRRKERQPVELEFAFCPGQQPLWDHQDDHTPFHQVGQCAPDDGLFQTLFSANIAMRRVEKGQRDTPMGDGCVPEIPLDDVIQTLSSCVDAASFDFHSIGFHFGTFGSDRLSQVGQRRTVTGAGIEKADKTLFFFWYPKQTCQAFERSLAGGGVAVVEVVFGSHANPSKISMIFSSEKR